MLKGDDTVAQLELVARSVLRKHAVEQLVRLAPGIQARTLSRNPSVKIRGLLQLEPTSSGEFSSDLRARRR